MPDPLNQYGDSFRPTEGHGVDIASQRQDELDMASLAFIHEQVAAGKKITAVDLGGGYGSHSVRMAEAGAGVTMIDIEDMASENFRRVIAEKSIHEDRLRFIRRDFAQLGDDDIPGNIE